MWLKNGILFLINICVFVIFARGQNNEFLSTKNFTPPSPEASAMARYGDIPTELSTGVPKINIPIYEIKSGKLSLPISLSYHASGIKVQDIATPVGLGWVLNCGGEISRNVIGKPDEAGLLAMSSNFYKNREDMEGLKYDNDGGAYTYLDDLAKGNSDSQSDIYNYSIGDLSGKFIYDVNKQLHFTPLDRQPIITWNYDSSFTIKDDLGNTYIFADKDYTTNHAAAARYITTWHLSSIISADGQDNIQFFYSNATTYREVSQSDSYCVISPISEEYFRCGVGDITPSFSSSSTEIGNERKLIDSIRFVNGYVKFEYVNDRGDALPERLSKVKIASTIDLIKTVELNQSYFISPGEYGVDSILLKRLRLDSVKLLDKNNQVIGTPHSFEYNALQLPRYGVGVNQLLAASKQMDYWGYYNANGANTLLPNHFYNQLYSYMVNYSGTYAVSNNLMQQYLMYSASRYANPASMGACVLKKINYPTGGYSAFEFEANRVSYSEDSIDYRGGLRVSKIVSFDTSSRSTIIKSYSYDSAMAVSPWIPQDLWFMRSNWELFWPYWGIHWCTRANFYLNANPTSSINYYNGSPVMYPVVTEYIGFPGDNSGKTVYSYEFDGDTLFNPESTDKYWNVSTDRSWTRGNLLNTKIYKSNGGSYDLLKETKNYYEPRNQKVVKVGEICEQKTLINYSTNGLYGLMSWPGYYNGNVSEPLTHFEYIDIYVSLGVKKLIKTEEIDYMNHEITNVKEFFYDGTDHLYPTKTLSYTSIAADTLKEITLYPQDRSFITTITPAGSSALIEMVDGNILMTPINTKAYRNNQLLFQNQTDYKDWDTNRFYEEFRSTQAGNVEPRTIQYKSYDIVGNPLTMSQNNGPDISYVWDYNKAYTSAQVSNASANEIAYTSFETSEGGNWSITGGSALNTSVSFTGQNSYNLTAGVNKPNLTRGKKYIVTYWSSSSAATVTWIDSAYTAMGTATAINKKTKMGWTLFEHQLPNTTVHITLGGNIVIDELRLYPEDAQMTSYTYQPLVGVTSSCSVNDVISKYEYDDFGRLKTIRDYDSNVLKTIDYSYNIRHGENVIGWKSTDTIRGQSKNGHATGVVERQERDFNSSSPTYNQPRWVSFDINSYNISEWMSTGDTICLTALGDTTGYMKVKHIDMNPYSTKYQKTKWIKTYNTTKCPLPCVLPLRKVINGICEVGFRVDTGAYYNSETGLWTCVWHYVWSDESYSEDYIEYNQVACPEDQ